MNFTTKFPEFKPWLGFKSVYELDGLIIVDSFLWFEDEDKGGRVLTKNDWYVNNITELQESMKELNAVYIIAEEDSQ